MKFFVTKVFIWLFALFSYATFSSVAHAASWYVDNAATGSGSGTSWTNAWTSLATINWTSVAPGDTVYISGGTTSKTYAGIIYDDNGTSGAPITIDSGANSPSPTGHSGEVIIDGSAEFCFRANGDYNHIKNLTCQDAIEAGFRIGGTGTILENNIIQNCYNQGIHVQYCTDCIVRGNKITTADDIAQQTDGIAVYDANNTIVEKNWIKITNQNNCESCHNDGIQASFSSPSSYEDITIRYNYVENTKASTANSQGIYLTLMQGDVKVYGNIVTVPIGGQAIGIRLLNTLPADMYVVGNTMKNGGYWVLRVEDDNPVIKNNLIWQTGGNVGYIENGALMRLDGLSGFDPTNVDYNYYYAPYADSSTYSFYFSSSARSWNTWRSTHSFDTNSSLSQTSTLDSCLRPAGRTHPTLDIGTNLLSEYSYGLSMDVCGTSGSSSFFPTTLVDRSIMGIGWDIGAYEYIPLTVSVEQAVGQNDPTPSSPVNFSVTFSEAVTDFSSEDITIGGTAGATTAVVTGSGTTYNVAISGMTGSGTIVPSLAADIATGGTSNTNEASTSTDNTVTYSAGGNPPVLTAITISDTSGRTNDQTPTITITSSNSPSHVAFSCNGGANWSDWITYNDTISSFDMTADSVSCSDTDGTKTISAKLKNSSNEESSTVSDSTYFDTTPPSISAISISSSANTATTIDWTTNEHASTQIEYGLTNSYGLLTTEADTPNRVESHSATIGSLVACSQYHYRARSKDYLLAETVSADNTFITAGCTGNATAVSTSTSQILTTAGGTLNLIESGIGLSLVVPVGFAGSDANFQIKKLAKSSVIATTDEPTGLSMIGNYAYDLSALSDISTKITTFNEPLTVSYYYDPDSIVGFDLASITLYRYDAEGWHELNGCSVDNTAHTVTCATENFSVYGLFGATEQVIDPTTAPTQAPGSSNTSSNNNSGTSTAAPAGCSQTIGLGLPDIFEVHTTNKNATLHFAPPNAPYSSFYISYSTKPNLWEHGVEYNQEYSTGAIVYTINELKPNTTYYFRVRSGNGCATGEWGNIISAKTTNSLQAKKVYYKNSLAAIVGIVRQIKSVLAPKNTNTLLSPVATPGQTNSLDAPTRVTPVTQPVATIKPQASLEPYSETPKKKFCILWWCF